MSVEIAWKQNNLVTDFHLLKLLQVVFGLGLQTFVCDFSRQNICSVVLSTLVYLELALEYRQKVKSKNYFAQVSNSTTKFLSVMTLKLYLHPLKYPFLLRIIHASFTRPTSLVHSCFEKLLLYIKTFEATLNA